MSTMIGSLNVQSLSAGYWFEIVENGPADWIAEVRGQRVLIPGRDGLYTPADNFEPEHFVVRYHGIVVGSGATHADAQTSFTTRMAALKTACDVATRSDVTLLEGEWTAQAGFLRFVGPDSSVFGGEGREFDIEFDVTDPPEWSAS